MRATENDSTRLYRNGISHLLLAIASSNLVGRKSKCYFIIKFSRFSFYNTLLERNKAKYRAKQLKMSLLQVFSEMTTQRSGFGQNACVADKQACALGSFEFNKHSVLKIFMINGLNFQNV